MAALCEGGDDPPGSLKAILDLRQPVSQLIIVEEAEENDQSSDRDERNSSRKTKTSSTKNDLATDCRHTHSALSAPRIELIKQQQESMKRETEMRKEDRGIKRAEHNLKMYLMET
ncbi:hypothetical protein ANN_26444 [Periplaneta americana]|uniref:Uncharacterized protein n=1 Tax=Periplaneta americana TaxID=6978 RepID=A0ABQ8RY91_PERAM|nr:hypothetical protein ANN_26444 [Periplaneta americana]